jgi:hypothetical protein
VKLNQFVVIHIAFGGNLSLSVAINTPTHGQGTVLSYDFHFLNRAVASLTLYSTYCHVLGMVEVR